MAIFAAIHSSFLLLLVVCSLPSASLQPIYANCSREVFVDPDHTSSLSCLFDLDGSVQRYHSLDCALEAISNSGYSSETPVCIELAAGKHVLNYSTQDIAYSVMLSAAGTATVTCIDGYNSSSDPNYTEFPLRFTNGTDIHLLGLEFKDCLRPLLFSEVNSVYIEDCQFSSFQQSALEIYNTPFVMVTNSSFTNNTSYGEGIIEASGNAGAVAIGFNKTFDSSIVPKITFQSTNFSGNVATALRCVAVDAVLSSRTYTQRGGGVATYFASPGLQAVVEFDHCAFTDNYAKDSGGGFYTNLSGGNNSYANITFDDCVFINNTAIDGGGIETTFDTPDSVDYPNFLHVRNCWFENNHGEFGGGIKVVQINSQGNLNRVRVEGSTFIRNRPNSGAAFTLQSPTYDLDAFSSSGRIVIKDCSFSENNVKRNVVFITRNNVDFEGNNTFTNNTGTAIRVSGSLVSLSGNMRFENNRNHHEGPSGTLQVASFAQILLHEGVTVSFINNTGREGAAIVAKSPSLASGFATTFYNPQCFLQFTRTQVPPIEWRSYNVSLEFRGNQAFVGPVLFTTNLDTCSWFNDSDPFFNNNIIETWTFINASDNYVIRGGDLVDSPELYVQTEMQALRIVSTETDSSETTVGAYPGQDILLNVEALDQLQNPTSGFVRITTEDSQIAFTPSVIQASAASNDSVSFYYTSPLRGTTVVAMEASFSGAEAMPSEFTLVRLECPPGLKLQPELDICVCEEKVDILACDPKMQFVLLDDGLWGASPDWSVELVTYPCPPGYCACTGNPNDGSREGCALIYDEPDSLCNSRRTGILCGRCRGDYGVGMLSMKCRKFTASFPMYYWMMPLLVIFIVMAVVILVKFGLSIPSFLLGVLFYLQVAPLAARTLSGALQLQPDIMACISSTLALYVPYDFSLRERLTALEAYGLRYISPLLVIVITPIVLRIKYRSKNWYGVWTLLLLMYAMTVETSCSLLVCPTLTGSSNGTTESITVWFYDGSVSCWSGSHLALGLISLLLLIFAALAIPAVALVVYQPELSRKLPSLDRGHYAKVSRAFSQPYKSSHRWWAPFELLRRYIFIMVVIFTPGYQTATLSLAGTILAIQWFTQPYTDRKANITEAFSLLMLVVVLCLGGNNDLVRTATGDSNFTLAPIFYLPNLVQLVCIGALIGWKVWNVYRRAQGRWKLQADSREQKFVPHEDTLMRIGSRYRTHSFQVPEEAEEAVSLETLQKKNLAPE